MNEHIIIVINYNNYEDTINCVESLLKLNGNRKIMIFDNNSTTDAYNILFNKYQDNSDIYFCKSMKNLGYSGGIDFAFQDIVRNKYEYDFIHTSNSDIIIEDIDFLLKIESFYNKKDFFMLGPRVITNKINTSPIGYFRKKEDFFKELSKLNILATGLKIFSMITFDSFENKLEGNRNAGIAASTIERMKTEEITPILSGCYTIFSKQHIEKFNYLYRPLTFLYNEEMIITYTLMNEGIDKIYFDEDIEVFHYHGGCSKGSSRRKAILIKQNIKELKKLKGE